MQDTLAAVQRRKKKKGKLSTCHLILRNIIHQDGRVWHLFILHTLNVLF